MASFTKSDLEFILEQILIAERHAGGEDLFTMLPNTELPWGLRTIDGSFNHLIPGQTTFGAADHLFPRMLAAVFRNDQDGDSIDLNGPAPGGVLTNTDYAVPNDVVDADPRLISNLIVDQTASNPAAYAVAYDPGEDGVLGTADDVLKDGVELVDGTRADGTPFQTFMFPAVAPDEGLSAPFNQWMTFFGQFFDHGLDLVTKGGNGTVFIPLQPDDPLFVPGGNTNFLVLTRATNQPGPDGVLGTADDIHEQSNTTSPDQNQTYSSHPSHQVFLRAYELDANGEPRATGGLIVNRDLGADGTYGTADDVVLGGMATWAVVKAQARDILGIDAYGNFLRGPNGFPQVVMNGNVLVEGNPAAPISLANAVRTGHAFLDDIAHTATPVSGLTPTGPGVLTPLTPDADSDVGNAVAAGEYDNELLETTNCSTPTSSRVTAASTRTSASPPCTMYSTPSTTAWSSTPRP